MGWYRKSSRSIFYAFRRYNSKTPTIARNQKSVSLNTFSLRSSSSSSNATDVFKPFWRNSILQNVVKNKQSCKSPFLDGAKRFYHVDTNQVLQFKPRGFRNWAQNPRNLFKLGCLGLLVSGVYLWNLETVPYTNRSHFVLFSTSYEKKITETWLLEECKREYEGRIVPSHHPESIRVQRILQKIVESAPKGLKKKKKIDDDEEEKRMINWFKKPSAKLEELDWEIILVNEPTINAGCATGGKIFVYTGLLDYFQTDAEIAAIIGHEVGHALARHVAEIISLNPWLILMLIHDKISKDPWLMRIAELGIDQLYQYFFLDNHAIDILSLLFLWLPFSRRMEKEADYIGLILMAAAGYDPRVVLEVWEKFEQYSASLPLEDYYSTHPSHETRAQLLSQPKVMEEAVSLYTAQRE